MDKSLIDFTTKLPDFDLPKNFRKVAGLVARANDAATRTPVHNLPESTSAAVRLEHAKAKKPRHPVLASLFLFVALLSKCLTAQPKRPRLSKDMVEDTDDEMPFTPPDKPVSNASALPPIPDDPIDFGNTSENKVISSLFFVFVSNIFI